MAIAQPIVRVRAEARIELRAEHHDGTIVVEGSLVDDRGEPLARQPVVVGIHQPEGATLLAERRVSDASGAFRIELPGEPTTYLLSARFAGDEYHPRLSVERLADLTRAPTRLRLRVGDGRFDLDRQAHDVGVAASSPRGGAGLTVTLADELGRTLGRGVTGPDGRLTISVPSAELGEPGAGRLVAHSRGDSERAEARVEAPITRYRQAHLELEANPATVRPQGDLSLRGSLGTSAGPSPGEAIGLYAGDEHLDTALTDEEGQFATTIAAADLPTGSVGLVARFESDGPGTPPAESETIWIEVRTSSAWVWLWLGVPLAFSLLVMLWLRRRAPPPEAERTSMPDPIGVVQVAPARRGPPLLTVSGTILDARGRTLVGRVRALAGDRLVEAICDASGDFVLELEAGRWVLELGAPRHAPVRVTADLPHRGELRGLTVRLESWRARALSILRDRFTKRGESLDRWRKTTVHSLRDDPALGPTASAVEVSYYGPLEPDGARIDELRGDEDASR